MEISFIGRWWSRPFWVVLMVFAFMLVGGVVFERHRAVRSALVHADPDAVLDDPTLHSLALDIGIGVFRRNCAACHGGDGRGGGRVGVGDLTRSARLYGVGLSSEIEQIVRHGIRSGDPRGWNLASMPAFATARPYPRYQVDPLTPADLTDVTQFVLSLSHRATNSASASRGGPIYAGRGQCFDCHEGDARGDTAIGAPDLTDPFWLYGGAPADIQRSIAVGRAGVSPAFKDRLSPVEQRAVAVYTASLIRNPQRRPE